MGKSCSHNEYLLDVLVFDLEWSLWAFTLFMGPSLPVAQIRVWDPTNPPARRLEVLPATDPAPCSAGKF